jgi:hypothetical protein
VTVVVTVEVTVAVRVLLSVAVRVGGGVIVAVAVRVGAGVTVSDVVERVAVWPAACTTTSSTAATSTGNAGRLAFMPKQSLCVPLGGAIRTATHDAHRQLRATTRFPPP